MVFWIVQGRDYKVDASKLPNQVLSIFNGPPKKNVESSYWNIIILERARALELWNDKEGLKWYLCFFPAQRYDPLYDPLQFSLSSTTHA